MSSSCLSGPLTRRRRGAGGVQCDADDQIPIPLLGSGHCSACSSRPFITLPFPILAVSGPACMRPLHTDHTWILCVSVQNQIASPFLSATPAALTVVAAVAFDRLGTPGRSSAVTGCVMVPRAAGEGDETRFVLRRVQRSLHFSLLLALRLRMHENKKNKKINQ